MYLFDTVLPSRSGPRTLGTTGKYISIRLDYIRFVELKSCSHQWQFIRTVFRY